MILPEIINYSIVLIELYSYKVKTPLENKEKSIPSRSRKRTNFNRFLAVGYKLFSLHLRILILHNDVFDVS